MSKNLSKLALGLGSLHFQTAKQQHENQHDKKINNNNHSSG